MEYACDDSEAYQKQDDDAAVGSRVVGALRHENLPVGKHSALGKVIGAVDYVAIRRSKDAIVVG